MARRADSGAAYDGEPDAISQLRAAISGTGADDALAAIRRLLAAGLPGRAAWPSRRHPGRGDVVTYQVRIDLQDASPPLWRRLCLASDLPLDQVHEVIQAAFGWTDSHLHRFGSGPGYYSRETEYYLCPFEVSKGESGIPEDAVRLDEVLGDVGSRLFYCYDFGDDWQHIIKLEAIRPGAETAPRAACTAGRRDSPPEDCGGIRAFEVLTAAVAPDHPDHAQAVGRFHRYFGDEPGRPASAVVPFDLEQINDAIAALGLESAPLDSSSIPAPLGELIDAIPASADRRRLRELIGTALAQPGQVDARTAARMVRSYRWLLDQAGADGIALTGAGYLPPALVEAAMAELGLWDEWIGKGNRESQTLPVLHLRESATKMGLLRKHRGRLVLTPRGRAIAGDPVALWWQLAERMPLGSADACQTQAGLILLAAVAAQSGDDLDATVARFLSAIGWVDGDGAPLTGLMAARAAFDTKAVLWRLGALADDGDRVRARAAADGVAFARAALQSWPSGPRPAGAR